MHGRIPALSMHASAPPDRGVAFTDCAWNASGKARQLQRQRCNVCSVSAVLLILAAASKPWRKGRPNKETGSQETPMSLQGQISVQFGSVFPDGAYAAGGIEMVRDFDRSTPDRPVQQADKETGLPLWVVEVIDAQENARQRTVKVKIAAQVQPVLPPP